MFKYLGIFLVMSLLLVGCGKYTKVPSSASLTNSASHYSSTVRSLPASESIQQLTRNVLKKRYSQVNNVSFEDYHQTDNVAYLAFSFDENRNPYYGFTVADKKGNEWELSWLETTPNDEKQPIAIFQFLGAYPDNKQQQMHITAGYVNNANVKQVILYYPNSNIKVINLGDKQHGFLDIDVNSKDSVLKIEGKSRNGETLYRHSFGSL